MMGRATEHIAPSARRLALTVATGLLPAAAILAAGALAPATAAAGGNSPAIDQTTLVSVSEAGATIEAQINPEGLETIYEIKLVWQDANPPEPGESVSGGRTPKLDRSPPALVTRPLAPCSPECSGDTPTGTKSSPSTRAAKPRAALTPSAISTAVPTPTGSGRVLPTNPKSRSRPSMPVTKPPRKLPKNSAPKHRRTAGQRSRRPQTR
jgi:hypothetical protein